MEHAEQLHEQFDRYRRIYTDTATWLAEALDGSMLTCFEYASDGRNIYAEDGSSMADVFLDSLNDAKRFVTEKPELAFELRRRRLELEEYSLMLQMVRGEQPNTMVVVSDFPPELMDAAEDVGGYNVARKQTMLRVIIWNGQKLKMFSQTLDRSDRPGLESIYHHFGETPAPGELLGQRIHRQLDSDTQNYLTSQLTGVYDRSLGEREGGEWHAGRSDYPRDTYEFVCSQHQTLDYFALKYLNRRPTDHDLYNLAAFMSKQFERGTSPEISVNTVDVVFDGMARHNVEWQLSQAGREAYAMGRTFSGCGTSVGNNNPGDDLSPEGQLQASGYGNKADKKDSLGSRWFNCPKGHPNYRGTPNKPEIFCSMCTASVYCAPSKPQPRKERKAMKPILTWGAAAPKPGKTPETVRTSVAPGIGKRALVASVH